MILESWKFQEEEMAECFWGSFINFPKERMDFQVKDESIWVKGLKTSYYRRLLLIFPSKSSLKIIKIFRCDTITDKGIGYLSEWIKGLRGLKDVTLSFSE